MSLNFEELDYRPTPVGALSLRRRRELSLGVDVFEIKLGDDYLMSSLFTASEVALARLGLAELSGTDLDVLVGGLGLGYTAKAVLECEAVKSLVIVEALDAVIDWHERGVLPLGPTLTADPRSKFVLGDFFALAASRNGFDPGRPARRFDAILVDIDHSPNFLLDPQNAAFYQPAGLQRLAAHLLPGGVFGLWSNEVPDDAFTQRLAAVFAVARAERVTFHNPLQDREFTQTIYLARSEVFKILELDNTTSTTPSEVGDGFATREDAVAAVKRHLKGFRASGHNPEGGYWWARDAEGLRKCWVSANVDGAIDVAGVKGPNRGRRGPSA
jgi:spermidine synthase